MESIVELKNIVDGLRKDERDLFCSIFDVNVHSTSIVIPDTFRCRVEEFFGAGSGDVEGQVVVRVRNKWTLEETLFNSLRAKRPGAGGGCGEEKLRRLIESSKKGCDFCDPECFTPEDTFGRIQGRYCITSANVARYDVLSSLVIFHKHNPLDFTEEEFCDYIETAFRWFERARCPEAHLVYPFLMWNCLGRAGASQVHGHIQVLMSQGYYSKVEQMRLAAVEYQKACKRDYFLSWFLAHRYVGLGVEVEGVKVFAHLTPVKEREVVMIGDMEGIIRVVFRVLRSFIDKLGVVSFNLGMAISKDGEFPLVVRVVDRGGMFNVVSDIGGMEIYGSTVVAQDPYRIIEGLDLG